MPHINKWATRKVVCLHRAIICDAILIHLCTQHTLLRCIQSYYLLSCFHPCVHVLFSGSHSYPTIPTHYQLCVQNVQNKLLYFMWHDSWRRDACMGLMHIVVFSVFPPVASFSVRLSGLTLSTPPHCCGARSFFQFHVIASNDQKINNGKETTQVTKKKAPRKIWMRSECSRRCDAKSFFVWTLFYWHCAVSYLMRL